jgi:putative tricarboxylic transport membrane protein
MLDNIIAAIGLVFTFQSLVFACFGVIVGFVFGALPGIGGNVAIGLLIPFTFYLDPVVAIVCLLAIGKGSSFGGSVPAILLNMPGTSQAAFTAIDGYQLTRKGQSKKALHMALYASVLGDLLSDVTLLLVAAPLAMVALKIGPPEYAAIVFLALLVIGAMVGSSPVKGLISAGLGLALGTVGRDLFTNIERFTFGIRQLEGGISVVPMLLGLLVFSEVLVQLRRELLGRGVHAEGAMKFDANSPPLSGRELRKHLPAILYGGSIGTIVGAIPGLGATVGAFLAYSEAKRTAPADEPVGRGSLRGIAAAESGNSAGTGANLIPLVTLGIPGNVEAALVLGAFMIHGLTPGPFLMQQQGPLLYAIFISLIAANLLLLLLGFGFLRLARYTLMINPRILLPIILVISTFGTYAATRQLFDVVIMLVFGLVGYAMRRAGFSPIPMLIAFLLGPILEDGIRRSLLMSGGDLLIFFERPISLAFIALAMISLFLLFRRMAKPRG